MPGRRPLPPGQARTEKLSTRVRSEAKETFLEAAKRVGMNEADALRQAASDWTSKILNHRSRP